MSNLHDTQPNQPITRYDTSGGPPKFLLYGVVLLFIGVIVGSVAAVVVFREVLSPSQRVRVIGIAPFMEAFLEPTPKGGILPTVAPASADDGGLNPDDLLSMPVLEAETEEPAATPTTAEATTEPETTPEATTEATAVSALATVEPTATATSQPTLPPSPIPATATPQETTLNIAESAPVASGQIPVSARMYGFRHEQQKWNNCGPATITMALSYFGWQNDQTFAGDLLKPNREDKNVSPQELANFVEEQTALNAMVRMGGDVDLLKALVANNFPVIIETGAYFEAYDWIGHYRALVAYDDTQNSFFFYDSFLGTGEFEQGVVVSYDETDTLWQAFNRTFIVVYLPEEEGRLLSILGSRADEADAAQHAFEVAQAEARTNPQNGFAWFNMGTSLTALQRYEEAATAFDQARRLGLPWRMLWYQFAPFEAYYQLGRYDDVLSMIQINLNNAEELEEMYYWRGRVLMAQNQREQAATAFRQALSYNPTFTAAREALDSL